MAIEPTGHQNVAMTLTLPREHRDRLRAIGKANNRAMLPQIRQVLADYLASHDDTGAASDG